MMLAIVIKNLSMPGANMRPVWCLLSDLPARVLVWSSYPLALCWCWWHSVEVMVYQYDILFG